MTVIGYEKPELQRVEPALADKERFMRKAIELAYTGMNGGFGGPFGAVVVKAGEIVGGGHNRVLHDNDPTAHAEVTAIREASRALANWDLSGSDIYVNGVPCPMCMAAIYWSRIDKLYYACLPEDAEAIGFDDEAFYRQLAKPLHGRELPAEQLTTVYDEARACYQAWLAKADRTPY
ncbi:MAG: nucleoside deaminase [Alphaproteobacteria bacterium]|nr:nucleoside deaminase [Alphaproteobacteria bacterium]